MWGWRVGWWGEKRNTCFVLLWTHPSPTHPPHHTPTPQNKGDALLNYENEIIATNDAAVAEGGAALPYVVPSDVNVRVTIPAAVVDGNIALWSPHSRETARNAASAFVDYLFTGEAQQELADAGFRPVRKVRRPRTFPRVSRLVSVEDNMGGWAAVQARFFDSGAELDGIMNEVIGRDADDNKR